MEHTYKEGFMMETYTQEYSKQQLLNEKEDCEKRLLELNAHLEELDKLESETEPSSTD